MTKAFLDSAYPPSAAQIAAAKAAGIAGWNGYFAGPNILNGWSKASFDLVKAGGLATMAYCSGWMNPSVAGVQSQDWAVKIALDVEGGIRSLIKPDDHDYLEVARPRGGTLRPGASAWVQPWLDGSGAGLYGNYWVHPGVRAPFYVLAAYPTSGDPYNVSWWSGSPRPGALCGWQWAGSHNFAGITADSNWFDDALYTYLLGAAPKPMGDDDDMLYVSKPHPVATTLRAYVASALFSDPSVNARQLEASNIGWTDAVDYYVYSTSGVESTTPPGTDHVWWHVPSHNAFIPDAALDTSGLPGGGPPMAIPANESMDLYFARRGEVSGGLSLADVDKEIDSKLTTLRITRV